MWPKCAVAVVGHPVEPQLFLLLILIAAVCTHTTLLVPRKRDSRQKNVKGYTVLLLLLLLPRLPVCVSRVRTYRVDGA